MNATTNKTQPTPKANKKAPTKKQATPTQVTTLGDLADAYPVHLLSVGKSASTAASYRGDLRVAIKHFGAETKLRSLTPKKVAAYFACDLVTKNRKGLAKSEITTAKIQRVFRLALCWATEAGHLDAAPLPAKTAKKGNASA